MTSYRLEKQKEFFAAYPAESIRVTTRLEKHSNGKENWKDTRVHEINVMKDYKVKIYQTTNKWY